VVQVIWHKTALLPHTDGSVVFARWRQCASHITTWPTLTENDHLNHGLKIHSQNVVSCDSGFNASRLRANNTNTTYRSNVSIFEALLQQLWPQLSLFKLGVVHRGYSPSQNGNVQNHSYDKSTLWIYLSVHSIIQKDITLDLLPLIPIMMTLAVYTSFTFKLYSKSNVWPYDMFTPYKLT